MKNAITVVFTTLFLFSCLLFPCNAALPPDFVEADDSLTSEEKSILQEKLDAYGYGEENVSADILYDADDCPAFMLGTTREGYVILRRNSYRFCECGDGNPYFNFMDEKKYYAGASYYFVQQSNLEQTAGDCAGVYYDILRETYSDFVPKTDSHDAVNETDEICVPSSTTSVLSSVVLPDSYDYLRRRAFGNNTDSTCSAVATGIALNYIALEHNMLIVKKDHVSEVLNKKLVSDKNPISTCYPNANRLHRYLVETCRMGPASYADDISQPVARYIANSSSYYYGYNFYMNWSLFPDVSTFRTEIANDRPILITTTLSAQYGFHTMCAYGYRDTSDGPQVLVHVGWYSKTQMQPEYENSDRYYQKTTWINANDATYAYYFRFSNPLANFTDIPMFTSWAYPGIVYTVNNGIMNGTSATTFSPNQTMSRAMLVSTLYRMAGSPAVTYASIFSDVPKGAYYANSVIWAVNNGIANGVGNGKFNPNGNVTREQIAVFLYRYAECYGYDTSRRSNLSVFSDYKSISSYAKDAVSWAVAEGIINGISSIDGPTVLSPQNSATRAQTAAFLQRFMENVVGY